MYSLETVFKALSDKELAYVKARSEQDSDAGALRSVKIPRSTFYSWEEARREELVARAVWLRVNRAIVDEREALDAQRDAQAALLKVTTKAVEAVESLLDSKKEHIRLAAAKAVLDFGVSKAPQRHAVEGTVEHVVKGYATVSPEQWPEQEAAIVQ